MSRTSAVALTLILVVAIAIANVEKPAPSNPAMTANNEFATQLFAQLTKANPGKNVFFSPFSMSAALAMTAEGARGETALQMAQALQVPVAPGKEADFSAIHKGMGELLDRLNPRAKAAPYELRAANALWAEKTYPFSQKYLDTLKEHYRTGGAFPVDFIGNAEAVRERINGWVAEKTNDRIKDLMPKGSLDSDTRLVLTNAIYFKGDWAEAFESRMTEENDFLLADGKKIRVPLMLASRKFGYAAFEADGSVFTTPKTTDARKKDEKLYPGAGGFTVAELPYKGGDLSMIVVLPQEKTGLPGLEKLLTGGNVQKWISHLGEREVRLFLPRFRLETEYDMKPSLQALGMKRAFENTAQFDGMTTDPEKRLSVSQVRHKAFAEVNEKGTEAAAATGIEVKSAALRPEEPFTPTFRADHPFLFLIRDRKTNTILFLGCVNNPKP
jgi:serpin B